ncbi:uncharacterized protein Dwil_GK27357 [Drosophila willistoni]|uniref:FLYWCH-type domain-containing protein n=1 Tax=Drosophila willistoni TaxID=7260 RepID=A0A0Q9WVS9_DROWI|nr:uncharacterized protein Dwil_GK27357 [Drosophila willistoni]
MYTKAEFMDDESEDDSKDGKLASTKMVFDSPSGIQFIEGQRNSLQIVYGQYAYAKNNTHGLTTYWNCRARRTGQEPCKARLSTTRLPTGKYKVCLTRPEHNHPPSRRVQRLIKQSASSSP